LPSKRTADSWEAGSNKNQKKQLFASPKEPIVKKLKISQIKNAINSELNLYKVC